MSAPISARISKTPVRVGLMPTFSITKSELGTMEAATNQKAAELISPGTVTSCPNNFAPPLTITVFVSISTVTFAPNAANIRSL